METMTIDRATGEVIETTGAAVPVVYRPAPLSFSEALERLTAPGALEQQQKLMDLYDRACRALVGPNDVQKEGDREFKKKSAWRKLGRFFGVSTEIVKIESGWEWDEQEQVRHFVARVIVRGTAPWGQSVEAVGLCSTRELRFYSRGKPNPVARAKAEHDVEATAATRATNRAISDLIAAGEVSAEEIGHDDAPEPAPRPGRPRASRPAQRPPEPAPQPAMGDSSPNGEMASERQTQFIRRLLAERDVDEATREATESAINAGQLTRREASRLIGELMSLPKVADADPAPAGAPSSPPFDDEDDDLPF